MLAFIDIWTSFDQWTHPGRSATLLSYHVLILVRAIVIITCIVENTIIFTNIIIIIIVPKIQKKWQWPDVLRSGQDENCQRNRATSTSFRKRVNHMIENKGEITAFWSRSRVTLKTAWVSWRFRRHVVGSLEIKRPQKRETRGGYPVGIDLNQTILTVFYQETRIDDKFLLVPARASGAWMIRNWDNREIRTANLWF